MGEAEDTFTKQEIQAGYVTSGRDVLARQQQIVAQALSQRAAAGAGTEEGEAFWDRQGFVESCVSASLL